MKKTDFNVLKFLVIFVLLIEGFYIYVGITSPGGKLFSPFLSKYLNFPDWLTMAIASGTKLSLQLAGYSVYQKSIFNITIAGSRGVNLAWACLGVAPMSLWVAFIAAHRGILKYKFKWIIAGIVAISIVNVFRVIMIMLSYYYNWLYLQHFNAHTSFNILTYAVILVFMYVFVRTFNKKKQKASISYT